MSKAAAAPKKLAASRGAAMAAFDIKVIHTGISKLGMDETTKIAMYQSLTGKSSSKDMTWQERKVVMEHLRAKGFTPTTPRKAGHKSGAPSRALDTSAQASKVRALWLALHGLGAVRDSSELALATYCARIAKVDALQWASSPQLSTLVETLKKWVIRVCAKLVPELMTHLLEDRLSAKTAADLQHRCMLASNQRLSADDCQTLVAELRAHQEATA